MRAPLELIVASGSVVGYSDSQLMDLLIRDRGGIKDLAFRALLERHGAMVWGVCRQLLGHACDADDAFQATFLVLIRKAGSLKVTGSLGPWLYQVAWRVAIQARSDRRGKWAGAAGGLEEIEQPVRHRSVSPDELAKLHGELNRLPAKYRLPIILCHLEGKTHEEAAKALRWPVGTVSGRLSRGRALLRSRLERRGCKSSEDLACVLVPVSHALRVPVLLTDSCLEAAINLASSGVIPDALKSLVKGVLKSMFWNRMKTAAAALIVIMSFAGTAGLLARGSLASSPTGDRNRPYPQSQGIESKSIPAPDSSLALDALGPQDDATKRPAASTRQPASDESEDVTVENAAPVVVKTVPTSGDSQVDPGLTEIRVTFSKPMLNGSWSWCTVSKNTFPEIVAKIQYLADHRTCVLPVKLQPGKNYATWLNTERFINFKDRDRRPAVPYLLVFRTKS